MLNVDDLKQKLAGAGFKVDFVDIQPNLSIASPDFVVRANVDGRAINFIIRVKERPHLAELRLAADQIKRSGGANQIPMIAAHFLGPNRRSLLREMGISYVDMAGNIYVRSKGIFVERDGKPNRFGDQQESLNPYSDKASIILRILMEEPMRSWKIREMAKAGGITPGWASGVVGSMVNRGLVAYNRQSGIFLLSGEDVLKEWADFYDWHKNRFYYYYCHAYDSQELLDKISKLDYDRVKFALGFLAGAYLVSPYSTFNQAHLLIDGSSFDIAQREIELKMELEQRKDGANLILVRPFYRYSALFHTRKIDKWWVVSDTQLYLDLNRYPLRGREQAEHLLQNVIMPKFNKMIKGKHGSKRV